MVKRLPYWPMTPSNGRFSTCYVRPDGAVRFVRSQNDHGREMAVTLENAPEMVQDFRYDGRTGTFEAVYAVPYSRLTGAPYSKPRQGVHRFKVRSQADLHPQDILDRCLTTLL